MASASSRIPVVKTKQPQRKWPLAPKQGVSWQGFKRSYQSRDELWWQYPAFLMVGTVVLPCSNPSSQSPLLILINLPKMRFLKALQGYSADEHVKGLLSDLVIYADLECSPIRPCTLSRDGFWEHLLFPSMLVSWFKSLKFVKLSFVCFPSSFLEPLGCCLALTLLLLIKGLSYSLF